MADLHTHVIPAVDDGAPDLESAVSTLRTMSENGVTAVVATPHLNASNLNSKRRARADKIWPDLVSQAAQEVPGIELHRGYEIQLDTPELDLSDPGLRLAGTRFALVEFFSFTVPDRSAEALDRINGSGYVPIIVHPERYWGYDEEFSIVPKWRDVGALLQVNSGSLMGEYGEGVRKTALHFLKQGMVDLIASDNHARPNRCPSLRDAWDFLIKRRSEEQARLLLSTNPHRILNDESPVPVGRLALRRGIMTVVTEAIRGEF
jgi:protein-tyrosine phosphatase